MPTIGFPLLLIPIAIYNIVVFLMPGAALTAPLFTVPLLSGVVLGVSFNDLILTLGILLLLFEFARASKPGSKYAMDHILSLVVLGAAALSDPALVDPKTMFVTFASKIFPGVAGTAMEWAMGIMLIIALVLSALNSLMGCSRSLYQMSLDGQFPRFYQHLNSHRVPDRAMLTNVIASLLIAFMGGAIEIYSFSNVGYLGSFVPVLIGYYILRRDRPNLPRPFKLPEYFKYIALALAALYFFVWLVGGIIYSAIGGQAVYYFLGVVTIFLYLPLYWYRKREDRLRGDSGLTKDTPVGASVTGG